MFGSSDSSIWSTFSEVMPNSSARMVDMTAQLTACAHCESPSRTAGPSGSLEKVAGVPSSPAMMVNASGPSG